MSTIQEGLVAYLEALTWLDLEADEFLALQAAVQRRLGTP